MFPIITLTTDFGLDDSYVGIMKGVILSRAPDARIIDLTHKIKPQDIQTAALTLQHGYPFFPKGCVHLIVVDPGVGSDRRIICLENDGHFFIGPDNGVLSPYFKSCTTLHQVTNTDLFLKEISNTFHGRDIMAPVAASLTAGLSIKEVGPSINPDQCVWLELPSAIISGRSINGTIIHIDHFGNLRSSITKNDLKNCEDWKNLRVSVGFHSIEGLSDSYADVGNHKTLAIIDSQGYLEVAVKNGSGAEKLNAKVGDRVVVRW